MQVRSLDHLSTPALRRELAAIVVRDRRTTAEMLVYLAEFDSRKAYVLDGYPSMFMYCVHELRFSEDVAYKRIRAARAARRFPAIHDAVAEGGLHLSAIVVLAPYLTPANAPELLSAAAHQTKARVEQLVAERFPQPDLPARIRALTSPVTRVPGHVGATAAGAPQLAPGPVGPPTVGSVASVPAPVASPLQLAPGPVAVTAPRPTVAPIAAERFAVQFTMDAEMHNDFREAQALLGHQVASGDLARIFGRALKMLVRELKKTKFAETDHPRVASARAGTNPRYIPAAVPRAIHERDEGRCTFVSHSGRRCLERAGLEFDHIEPIARGGGSNVENLRLRCRAHNQYEAERAFGAGFMDRKRDHARRPGAHQNAAARADT